MIREGNHAHLGPICYHSEPSDVPYFPTQFLGWDLFSVSYSKSALARECVRNLDLRVQVHPGDLWASKQRVHIVLEASKSAGAKGDVPKICGFVHPLHPL